MRVRILPSSIASVFAAACASAPAPVPQTTTPVITQPSVAAVSAVQAGPLEPASSGSATGANEAAVADIPAPAEPPVVDPTAAELCGAYCARLGKQCSATLAEECEYNCVKYQAPPGECTGQVHAALACAKDAPDLACVNMAPASCAPSFRRLVACVEGREVAEPVNEIALPSDWQRVQLEEFAVAMPAGAEPDAGATQPGFVAREGDVSYSARLLPAPAQRPTQRNSTALSLSVLGSCNRNLKVFSVVEKPDRYSNRFSATCPNGVQRQGHLVLARGKLLSLTIEAPSGAAAELEPFLFGFEIDRAR